MGKTSISVQSQCFHVERGGAMVIVMTVAGMVMEMERMVGMGMEMVIVMAYVL